MARRKDEQMDSELELGRAIAIAEMLKLLRDVSEAGAQPPPEELVRFLSMAEGEARRWHFVRCIEAGIVVDIVQDDDDDDTRDASSDTR